MRFKLAESKNDNFKQLLDDIAVSIKSTCRDYEIPEPKTPDWLRVLVSTYNYCLSHPSLNEIKDMVVVMKMPDGLYTDSIEYSNFVKLITHDYINRVFNTTLMRVNDTPQSEAVQNRIDKVHDYVLHVFDDEDQR